MSGEDEVTIIPDDTARSLSDLRARSKELRVNDYNEGRARQEEANLFKQGIRRILKGIKPNS